MSTVNDVKAPQVIQTEAITTDYSAERVAMNVKPSVVSSRLSASERNVRVSPMSSTIETAMVSAQSKIVLKPTVANVSAERVAMNVQPRVSASGLSASEAGVRISAMNPTLHQSVAKAQATVTIRGPSPKYVIKNF